MKLTRIAWGITGAGDKIEEILDIMIKFKEESIVKVEVFLSKAGKQVMNWYKIWNRLNEAFEKVKVEVDANVPFIAGPLQVGRYDVLVIAPLSANSTAKIAYGIEDTLLTNAVAQTLKGTTPVLVYPIDQFPGTVETIAPDGRVVKIRTRQIDLENVDRLRDMEGLTVLESIDEIHGAVVDIIGKD
ncbi:MAG: archaeoflavoprotein AfpA [Candidatus Thorarchaeota archaeon]